MKGNEWTEMENDMQQWLDNFLGMLRLVVGTLNPRAKLFFTFRHFHNSQLDQTKFRHRKWKS